MSEKQTNLSYLAVLDPYALTVGDKEWSDFLTDAVTWGNTLNRTAEIVQPDRAITSAREAVRRDHQGTTAQSLDEVRINPDPEAEVETFCEAAEIFAEISDTPIVLGLPGPVDFMVSQFGSNWLDFYRSSPTQAGDQIFDFNQYLAEIIRSIGETEVGAIYVEDRNFPQLSVDEADELFLEYQTLRNVCDHFDLSLMGHYPDETLANLAPPWELYEAVIGETEARPPEGVTFKGSTGRSIPRTLWKTQDPSDFNDQAKKLFSDSSEKNQSFLVGDIPSDSVPERVVDFHEILAESRD